MAVLKLVMPYVNKQLFDGFVIRWHKHEGDRVGFGDNLADIEVDKLRQLRRPRTAAFGVDIRRSRRTHQTEPEIGERSNVSVAVRVVSSDSGYMRRIEVVTGERVAVGEVMAFLTTTAVEPLSRYTEAMGRFRALANVVEGWEDE